MNRRTAIRHMATCFLVTASLAHAQQPAKSARIGYLDSATTTGSAELLVEFRKQMTQFNWIEGKNLTVEYRYGEGKGFDRLAGLADELTRLKLDAIMVSGASAALAAKKATSTTPIIMVGSGDAVAQGLVTSLARPGGNLTGLSNFPEELAGKRLEILKEVLPKSTRIGVIIGTGGPGGELQLKAMKEVASVLGLKLVEIGAARDSESLVSSH